MSDLNGTNNSDSIRLNTEQTAPTLSDIITNNNNLKGIDDIITENTEKIASTSNENIILNESEKDTLPKMNIKMNETEPLSLNILSKNSHNESSSVIQVPESIKSDNQDKYLSRGNTLNEPIITTINRDLSLIYTKMKFVVNPFISKEQKKFHIRQWDLWGPLLLNMILACTLSFNTKEKSQITILIFIIFWLGGMILYLNANFLGVKSSIFQIFCLLGYCLFPLNLSAIFVTVFKVNAILRLIIVAITCIWSIYSSSDFLSTITNPQQRYLVLYPCILFYLYISWFIISIKN